MSTLPPKADETARYAERLPLTRRRPWAAFRKPAISVRLVMSLLRQAPIVIAQCVYIDGGSMAPGWPAWQIGSAFVSFATK